MTNFETVLFFILIALLFCAAHATYNHSPEKEVQEDESIIRIKKDCKAMQCQLEKIKFDISNDQHIKEEAMAFLTFVRNNINRVHCSDELYWDKYLNSKLKK